MRVQLLPTLAILYASQAAGQAPTPRPPESQPVVPTAPPGEPAPASSSAPPAAPPPLSGQGQVPTSTAPPPSSAPAAPAQYPYAYPNPPAYGSAGQPPPGYTAYPAQNYPPPTDPRPRYLPYQPGEPAPAGYRYEESVRSGPIVAGAITAGAPYLLGLLVASSENFTNKRGFLVMPVFGPWLTLLTRDSTCDEDLPISECSEDAGARMVLTIDGMLQTGGAILMAYGLLNPKRRYALEQYGAFNVSPRWYRGGAGLGATGYF